MREINKQEYINYFINSTEFPDKTVEIHRKAYEIAQDNRKFEIEHYWKRATYYWVLQATVYAGYFYSVAGQNTSYLFENKEIIIGITCLGFVTALAWFFANMGSRAWVSNWENHVFELEDGIVGPLGKTISHIETKSVTGINVFVSQFSIAVWILLGLKTVYSFYYWNICAFTIYAFILVFIAMIFWYKSRATIKHRKIKWFGGKSDT